MRNTTDNLKRFILASIISHTIVLFLWGKIVVHQAIAPPGEYITVSLSRIPTPKIEPKPKPKPKKKVIKKKVEKPKPKQDKSIALNKTKKPVPIEEEVEEVEKDTSPTVAFPKYGSTPRPGYPAIAIRRGIEGKVLLEVYVLPNGNPADILVFKSSGHKVLDRAAVKAVKKWKFVPAQKGFSAVESWVKVPIEFKLR